MQLHVGTYKDTRHGYAGWVSDRDAGWTLFVGVDGSAELYRDGHPVAAPAPASGEQGATAT